MLRTLLVLLLLANAGFYAWTQGWLAPWLAAPRPEAREPERLQAQVKPELITVMTPKAASAAIAAAREAEVCLEAGPFPESAVGAAETTLVQNSMPDGSWTREAMTQGPAFAVYMGRFADRDVLRSKADELKRLKIPYEELNAPPLLAPGLKLSSHDDRAAAEAALVQLTQKGVRTARVVEIPSAAGTQVWLRVARADTEMQVRLKAMPAAALAGGFVPCRAAQ